MEKKQLFLIDTNVFLHDHGSVRRFGKNDIGIPIQVIIELDNFKKGKEPINYCARDVLREIESLPSKQIYDGGASLGENLGKLRIIVGHPYHSEVKKIFPEQTMDHLILNAAYCLNHSKKVKESNTEVILVSKDVNLRLKAGALGLMAEDYQNDKVLDVPSLFGEIRKFEIEEEEITELYTKKHIEFKAREAFFQNEFMILNASKRTALSCFKNDVFTLIKDDLRPFGIKARNSEQSFALHALLDPKISLVTMTGKAGTGKTLLAIAAGLHLMKNNQYEQIYFTREAMGLSNKDIGFLPGGINDKLSPYMQGLQDNISLLKSIKGNKKIIEDYEKSGELKLEALTFIRGRSIPNTFFIIDEAQNLTHQEVKTILTRAGVGTKIILIGDVMQIDTPFIDLSSNGLSHVISSMRGQSVYSQINLVKGERSELAELAANLL